MIRENAKIKITAVVPSAGKGIRFKSRRRKPFANLNGRPVLFYALKALQSSRLIQDIVLVIDRPLVNAARRLVKRYSITKVARIIEGGKTRTDSVRRGLRSVDNDVSLVLIHDGVRPFASKEIIKKTVAAALKFGASVSAVPVKATIKVSKKNAFVKYTPERESLWEAQTPQVFKKVLIDDAYKRIKYGKLFTDDAAVMENAGKKVKIVRGGYNNIKITTVEDIKMGEALLHDKNRVRL